MDLIGLLVFLIVVGLIFWSINALSGAFGIPAPIVTVLHVVHEIAKATAQMLAQKPKAPAPAEEVEEDEEDAEEETEDDEDEAIDRIAAALSKGGTVNIMVKP